MNHPLLDIPELLNLQSGEGIIRIPSGQDVPFTSRVQALVDTTEFQRLRHVTQLGLTSLVYPGATHTRFEHALGVYHNALRYLWQLGKDPRFCDIIDQHFAEVLIVSSLLHDLGHWPFCHPIEDMALGNLPPHEEFAAQFLSPQSELSQVLQTEWNVEPAEVLDVLVKKSDSPPMRLLRSILSGPIDIDKMDYLERDSLHCGVPYGRNYDKNRLMQSLVLNEAGDGLAITNKGKTAAEMMVFARYVMFSEVYWHHTVRSATSMFARGFYDLHQNMDLQQFFLKTEEETIATLRTEAAGKPCERLIEGIFGSRRSIYKRVAEFSVYQHPVSHQQLAGKPYHYLVGCAEKLAQKLSSLTGESIEGTDLLFDAPPPDREVEFKVDIYFPKENIYRTLGEVSPVVDALAREQFDDYVKRVRIFAHPRLIESIDSVVDFPALLNSIFD
ncbi:dNTP triphosphohydrolase, broad substrate specificity [hydrothermal vent metagenome]|uniref:DNTP triphosphohydrolase, broad substrate specificity n=1 Tax=hydrothermal vent metagenome TaxID=652676 RepID=A0A3B1DKI6_9ZZZZ